MFEKTTITYKIQNKEESVVVLNVIFVSVNFYELIKFRPIENTGFKDFVTFKRGKILIFHHSCPHTLFASYTVCVMYVF